jgi:hypothetical protein
MIVASLPALHRRPQIPLPLTEVRGSLTWLLRWLAFSSRYSEKHLSLHALCCELPSCSLLTPKCLLRPFLRSHVFFPAPLPLTEVRGSLTWFLSWDRLQFKILRKAPLTSCVHDGRPSSAPLNRNPVAHLPASHHVRSLIQSIPKHRLHRPSVRHGLC